MPIRRATPLARHRAELPADPLRLTSREEEVLHWKANGKRDNETARILGVRRRTVEKHHEKICEKLDVETLGTAVLFYFERIIAQRDKRFAQQGRVVAHLRRQLKMRMPSRPRGSL